MIQRYKPASPKSILEYYEARQRATDRRKRRKGNALFIAKIKGIDVLETRTVVKAQLDHLSSLIVRRRDMRVHAGLCLVCMAKQKMCILKRAPNPITQAYHIVPRGDFLTRWDLRNQVGSCWSCNFGEKESRNRQSTKDLYRRIHVELLGGGVIGADVLHDLEYLATQTTKYSTAELIAKRDELKSHLERK